MDRSEFLKLCERLGSPDDREVVATARAITAELERAGMTWDQALAPDETAASAKPEDATDADLPDDDPEVPVEAPATAEDPAETAAANARSLALIEKLLARDDLSEELREDMESYKDDIKSGSLDRADRAYIEAVTERLGKAK